MQLLKLEQIDVSSHKLATTASASYSVELKRWTKRNYHLIELMFHLNFFFNSREIRLKNRRAADFPLQSEVPRDWHKHHRQRQSAAQ